MTKKRSLKALKEKIKSNTSDNKGSNSGGLFYPHWNLPADGQTAIRILEDADDENDLIVYREFKEHTLNIGDDIVRVPCRKNLGYKHNCPICELSQKFYKADNEKKGKYYYRDQFLILRGLVTKDGLEPDAGEESAEGQVKLFRFSWQLVKTLESEIGKLDEDEGEFWDLDDGLDFIIEKQITKGKGKDYPNYDTGSGFARRQSSIPKDWRESITDEPLSKFIPEIPTYDEADEILQKHLKAMLGEDGDDDDDDDGETNNSEMMDRIARKNAEKKAKKESSKKKEEVVVDDDDDDDAEENALESLADLADDDDDDDDADILSQFN